MENILSRYQKFFQSATTILGGLMGLLIALPLAVTSQSRVPGIFIMILFTTLGFVSGYRRRSNRIFLYFCLGGVIILSTLISFSLLGPTPEQ